MVETLRAMVAELEKNEELAQAALANTMGLSWDASIIPADKELPYTPTLEISADWSAPPTNSARIGIKLRLESGRQRRGANGKKRVLPKTRRYR